MLINLNNISSENRKWLADFVKDSIESFYGDGHELLTCLNKNDYLDISDRFIEYLANQNIKEINTRKVKDLDTLCDDFDDLLNQEQENWFEEFFMQISAQFY